MKFSFVIPAYNVKKYIRQCITSITRQCNPHSSRYQIEVIVIDDGSPDNLWEIVKELEESDCRIRLIRQNNGGLSSARNTGMKYAMGDYIFFVDGDDFFKDSGLESLFEFIESDQSDLILFGADGYQQVHELYTHFFNPLAGIRHTDAMEVLKAYLMEDYSFGWVVWHYAFKKETIIRSGLRFIEGRISEDVDFVYKYWCMAKTASTFSGYLYNYRMNHTGSISQTASFSFVRDLGELMAENLESISSIKDMQLKTLLFLNYQTLSEVILYWYEEYYDYEKAKLCEIHTKLKGIYEIPYKYRHYYRKKERLTAILLKTIGFDSTGWLWNVKKRIGGK